MLARRARKAGKAKGKAQNPRMVTPSRKVLAITVARSVTLHVNVRRRSKQCKKWCTFLTYTDDQSQWIMMLAEVGQNQEQSNNIELLVDSGVACHAWPFKTKSGSSRGGTFLTATGTPVASQGTVDVSFQLVDAHGVENQSRSNCCLSAVQS